MSFLESLSEDIRGNEHLEGIESADALATAYIDAKSNPFSGMDETAASTLKDRGINDANSLYETLLKTEGKLPKIPESPDNYTFDFPDGKPQDEAGFELFKKAAHKLGLDQQMFKGLVEFDQVRTADIIDRYETARKEAMTQLMAETKLTEDQINSQVETVVKALGWEDLAKRLDVNSDPVFIKSLLSLKEKISEDTLNLKGTQTTDNEVKRNIDGTPQLSYPSMQT